MIYDIHAAKPVDGKHWELHFTAGHAETEDAQLAEKYRKRGYLVRERGEAFNSELPVAPIDGTAGAETPVITVDALLSELAGADINSEHTAGTKKGK